MLCTDVGTTGAPKTGTPFFLVKFVFHAVSDDIQQTLALTYSLKELSMCVL